MASNLYQLCKETIEGMEVGDFKMIDMPSNVNRFRRYMLELAARKGKKITTKTIDGKLRVMRIKYYADPKESE